MGIDQPDRQIAGGLGSAVTCAEFRAAHAEYVDGLLRGRAAERMRRHASECLPCARHDRNIRRGCALMGALPEVRTADDFTVRLRSRLARDRARRRRLISTGQLLVPGAAVIALVAAVSWSPLLRSAGPGEPVDLAPVQARAPVGLGIPALGSGTLGLGNATRLYRAHTVLPGVWLGDAVVVDRPLPLLLRPGSDARDAGYPTVFLDPPEFRAQPSLIADRVFVPDPLR